MMMSSPLEAICSAWSSEHGLPVAHAELGFAGTGATDRAAAPAGKASARNTTRMDARRMFQACSTVARLSVSDRSHTVGPMSVETAEELAGLRRVGRLVARTLRALRREVRPGVTTGELDAVAAFMFGSAGATSAPRTTYGFPGTICISVNDEIVHGVPGARVLRAGDLVTLDVTPELDGFVADAAITVPVGPPTPEAARLLRAAHACLREAVAAAVAGGPLRGLRAAPR